MMQLPSRNKRSYTVRMCVAVLAAASQFGFGSALHAEEMSSDARRELALRVCDPNDRQRIEFLEERLHGNQTYARRWQHTWNAIYVLGMAFEGTRAGLEEDHGERATSIASAAKSLIGLARGLSAPPVARLGSEGLEDPPLQSAEDCKKRLERAEGRLREAAHETASKRWSWIPHAVNLGLNAGAAVFVAETYEHDPAYWSGLLGLGMGELRLWTYPWQATRDLEDYEARFDENGETKLTKPNASWRIEAWSSGARLVVRF